MNVKNGRLISDSKCKCVCSPFIFVFVFVILVGKGLEFFCFFCFFVFIFFYFFIFFMLEDYLTDIPPSETLILILNDLLIQEIVFIC